MLKPLIIVSYNKNNVKTSTIGKVCVSSAFPVFSRFFLYKQNPLLYNSLCEYFYTYKKCTCSSVDRALASGARSGSSILPRYAVKLLFKQLFLLLIYGHLLLGDIIIIDIFRQNLLRKYTIPVYLSYHSPQFVLRKLFCIRQNQ